MTAVEADKVATASGDGDQSAKEIEVISTMDGVRRDATATGLDPIASALRRLHDDVVSEPIPDDFMQLLANIDNARESRSS